MERTAACSRLPGTLLLAMALAMLAGAISPLRGAEAAADAKEEAKPRQTFSPEVEAKLTEFRKKMTEAKGKLLLEQMQKEAGEAVKATGLSGEPVKALDAAARKAADQAVEDWSAKFNEMMLKEFAKQPQELILTQIEQALPMVETIVKQETGEMPHTDPVELPVWTEALRRTLSSEQLAAWDKVKAGRNDEAEKELGVFLDSQVTRAREMFSQPILSLSNSIALTLGLSKERAEQLDALAKSAAEQSAKDVREPTKKTLLAMSREQRSGVIKNGYAYLSSDEKNLPDRQPVWKDGLAKFLTEDEQKRLMAAQEDHKAKRIRALGQLLVALLDEKVAFTASQRQQLQPIAERLVKGEPPLFPDAGSENYSSFDPSTFYGAAGKATEGEIKAILDPVQWKRWREAGAARPEEDQDNPRVVRRMAAGPAPTPEPKPPAIVEPEDVERTVSDFLSRKSESERKRLLAIMTLKAEDAGRICALAPNAVSRLQTAARGAAEESLSAWRSNTDSMVHSQVQDATAQNVKLRLESIDSYYFHQNSAPPDNQSLWEKTVKTELTEPQRDAWKKETDARTLFRDGSIVAFLLAEFDRKNPLTPQQWEKLEPLISGVFKEYGPDIFRMFSSYSNESPWYLQYYSMFMPFAGVPENDLKAILGKEQTERWMGSSEFSNCTSYWENIQTYHKQRVQEAKAGK